MKTVFKFIVVIAAFFGMAAIARGYFPDASAKTFIVPFLKYNMSYATAACICVAGMAMKLKAK